MAASSRVAAFMVLGTGSDVGKSLLVAGLARAFSRRGLTVRPFKPQNMSNNAAVTADGGEIGRAQALQARACFTQPVSDMNPVLLKPQSETGAQIVVQGRVEGNATARDYAKLKATLLPRVLESFARLSSQADLVLVEGAGSPAEVNLRAGDIANMGFAEAADVPCVLLGDIDRGGVIASIVGTHALLSDRERQRIKGYTINKFRGDVSLFSPALEIIGARTGWKSFGVLPHLPDLSRLPPEDGVALEQRHRGSEGALRIVVPHLPGISNIDDVDPLAGERGVSVTLIQPGQPLPREADLILLPGSKTTIADLAALRREGWDIDILAHARSGGHVLGLCGGYQMLGRTIADPQGMEGPPAEVPGLGLLDISTTLRSSKRLVEINGFETRFDAPISGYEMHIGLSTGPDRERPFAIVDGVSDGAISENGRIAGTYLHGIFGSDRWRQRFIESLGGAADPSLQHGLLIEKILDHLAAACEHHLDLDGLWEIAQTR